MFTRDQIISSMKQMRVEIETNRVVSFEAACLLYDSCAAIGFTEAETQEIMGTFLFLMVSDVVEENGVDMEGYFNDEKQQACDQG